MDGGGDINNISPQNMLRGLTCGPPLFSIPSVRILGVSRRRAIAVFSTDSATYIYSLASLDKPAHHASAAEWADNFKQLGLRGIPKDAYEISMSRSSGP